MKIVKVSELKKGDYFKRHMIIDKWRVGIMSKNFGSYNEEYDIIGKVLGMGTKTPYECVITHLNMITGKKMRVVCILDDEVKLLSKEEVNLEML